MSPRDIEKIREALCAILGKRRVITDPAALKQYSEDMTEAEPASPEIAVKPRSVEEVRKTVKYAAQERIPITPVVAGTNLGGLALPVEKGIVMDLKDMNNIVELNRDEMYAILEPGVTFGQLKEHMEHNAPELTIGYPLSPPNVSVMCNCLLDGLGNLSLKHGTMGEWINGLEAVLPNGELIRPGQDH
jgi:glycolate oxidase